jgi:hypothetical protein
MDLKIDGTIWRNDINLVDACRLITRLGRLLGPHGN